jgi:hypothetical protein
MINALVIRTTTMVIMPKDMMMAPYPMNIGNISNESPLPSMIAATTKPAQ